MSLRVPEALRVVGGRMGSGPLDGNNGAFVLLVKGERLNAIASDGAGWEHVSVSHPARCPTWEEMCYVKALFWEPEDVVIQYHPAEAEHVNIHPYCLHLWRCLVEPTPMPPTWMI
jgi:hypothetical protein